jgi:hypothetical protein
MNYSFQTHIAKHYTTHSLSVEYRVPDFETIESPVMYTSGLQGGRSELSRLARKEVPTLHRRGNTCMIIWIGLYPDFQRMSPPSLGIGFQDFR